MNKTEMMPDAQLAQLAAMTKRPGGMSLEALLALKEKVRRDKLRAAPTDKPTSTVADDMMREAGEAPVGIAALPQMSQGAASEEVGVAGFAAGGQVSDGYPTPEIKEQSKNDAADKRMSDFAEYKANGGTESFEIWMRNNAPKQEPKRYAFGGEVEEDTLETSDSEDLEKEYAMYAAMQGYTDPVAASAPYIAPPAPVAQQAAAPTAEGKMPFSNAITHTESRGRDFDKNGKPLTSSAGAMFARQVMPKTAASPGFGIKPAASQTPEEYNRVGIEYENALLRKYNGNQAKVAAAYNAGPGTVDKAVRDAAKVGEPDNWRAYMRNHQSPSNFKQTYDYVGKVAGLSGIRAYAKGGRVEEEYPSWYPEVWKRPLFSTGNLGGVSAYVPKRTTTDRPATADDEREAKYKAFAAENPGEYNPYVSSMVSAGSTDPKYSGITSDIYGHEYGFAPGEYRTPLNETKFTSRPPVVKAAPAVAKPVVKQAPAGTQIPTGGIPAAAESLGRGGRSILGMEPWWNMYDQLVPKIDPELTKRIEKERAGNFDRTLLDVGLNIMGGTSPHALVNAGQGAAKGMKAMDERMSGLDKRQMLLAQAEQARAMGNLKAAAALYGKIEQLDAFDARTGAMYGAQKQAAAIQNEWGKRATNLYNGQLKLEIAAMKDPMNNSIFTGKTAEENLAIARRRAAQAVPENIRHLISDVDPAAAAPTVQRFRLGATGPAEQIK